MKKLLVRVGRQSPALIVAMLALFVALTGTAVATTSALIGSAQIRNNSITGLDVKNRSLRPIDFRGSVRGPRGLTGPQGVQGIQGPKGDKGDTGPTDLSKFGRASQNTGIVALNNGTDGGYVTELSTQLSSGASAGFVIVQANMGAYTASLAQCPCQIELRVRDATTGTAGFNSFAQVGNVGDADGWAMDNGAVSGVFAIGANETHTYDFQAVVDDNGGTPDVSAYVSISAVYVPFNATGAAAALEAARLTGAGANP